jgi:WD40 repeat protein
MNRIPLSAPFDPFCSHVCVVDHWHVIICLAMDITSQILITGLDDSRIKVESFRTDVSLAELLSDHCHVITDIQTRPSNSHVAISSTDGCTCLYSLRNAALLAKLDLGCPVHAHQFSSDNPFLATALEEGSVRLFSVSSLKPFFSFPITSGGIADSLSFSG